MAKLPKNWYKVIPKNEQEADRYELLKSRVVKLGFNNVSDAFVNAQFCMWVKNLTKFNKSISKSV